MYCYRSLSFSNTEKHPKMRHRYSPDFMPKVHSVKFIPHKHHRNQHTPQSTFVNVSLIHSIQASVAPLPLCFGRSLSTLTACSRSNTTRLNKSRLRLPILFPPKA